MAVVIRNEFGAIAVNRIVLNKMVIEQLLDMENDLILCNKKGVPIKKNPTPFIDSDYYDAVELTERKNGVRIKIFIIVIINSEKNIADITEQIMDRIEENFELLKLDKPRKISIYVKGIKREEIDKRNIEVVRRNV